MEGRGAGLDLEVEETFIHVCQPTDSIIPPYSTLSRTFDGARDADTACPQACTSPAAAVSPGITLVCSVCMYVSM